ncbi:hypothetical protein DFH09DRAFT_1368911 [Mycena vulgaris]|nr:hypothetical protein DFH09DRAFT_1368911 [Mycena vulgaris]
MSTSRPSASTALWGQLLRKNTLAAPSVVPLPPTAPLDKTGTSMRILLHDTQANFEKFSTRVDTLTSGIDGAKREIVIVKDLFQREHETLTMDVVDLVNRSQTQIQKSLGEPAQAMTLESFRKDVDSRLDGLAKRIDDMQSFNQTQSQALQNVSQTLQSLQDQQGKILSALLPLLPLLQAVPVHLDSARSSINETILRASLETSRMHRTPPHMWPQPPQVMRKRSFPTGPPSSPLLSRKRPRLEHERLESDRVTPQSTIGDHSRGGYPTPRPPSRRPTFSANNGPYFLVGPGCPPISRPPQGYRTPSLSKPLRDSSAPRRPLGDLPIPAQIPSLEPAQVQKDTHPPPAHQTPLISRSLLRTLPQPDSMPRTPSKGRLLPEPATPQRPETPNPAHASSPSPIPSPNQPLPLPAAPTVKDTDTVHLKALDTPAPLPENAGTPAQSVRNKISAEQQSAALPVKTTMVRGRRSPFRDGRRFIALDDDDSDSDDD